VKNQNTLKRHGPFEKEKFEKGTKGRAETGGAGGRKRPDSRERSGTKSQRGREKSEGGLGKVKRPNLRQKTKDMTKYKRESPKKTQGNRFPGDGGRGHAKGV